MRTESICTLVLTICASVIWCSSVYADTDHQTDYERIKGDIEQLEKEQGETIQEWMRSGKDTLESFKSPLISAEDVSQKLPPECLAHLKEEKKKLEQGGYSKEAWLHHIFECERCCAPLLADIMDIHIEEAIRNPHSVALFDFDTYGLKEKYQRNLNKIMNGFDENQDRILLIGRASKVGTRAYNIILSGKRAAEVKDYCVEHFAVDESKIRFLYFGYDPPQLTLDYAQAYGITVEDLASIDAASKNADENKINQSVVVIIYKGADDADDLDRAHHRQGRESVRQGRLPRGKAPTATRRAPALPLPQEATMPMAVFDFTSIAAPKEYGVEIAGILRTVLSSLVGPPGVVARETVQQVLEEQGLSAAPGGVDAPTAVEVGERVGAGRVVVGSVVKLGKVLTINLRAIDVKTGQVKVARILRVQSADELPSAVPQLALVLTEKTPAALPRNVSPGRPGKPRE